MQFCGPEGVAPAIAPTLMFAFPPFIVGFRLLSKLPKLLSASHMSLPILGDDDSGSMLQHAHRTSCAAMLPEEHFPISKMQEACYRTQVVMQLYPTLNSHC